MDGVRRYNVVAERDEAGWWAVRVDELPGVLTQAKRLDQVEGYAREAIDVAISIGHARKGKYSVEVDARVPGFDAELEAVRGLRADAERVQAEATERTRAIARRLADSGLTVRDIGAALGLSHQRAAQLVAKSVRAAAEPAAKRVTGAKKVSTRRTKKATQRRVRVP